MIVGAVRAAMSQRKTAQRFGVALCTVQRWMARADGNDLGRVDWSGRPRTPNRMPRRTGSTVELAVRACRKRLRENSPLGFYGAEAIHEALQHEHVVDSVPCVRTIGRILRRNGMLDGRRRIRRTPPPPGWYLADLALGHAEMEAFDVIEGLVIEDHGDVDVLTGRALWGSSTMAWVTPKLTAKLTAEQLLTYWRANGLPDYAQFDNDTRFEGPHQHRDVVGRVARTCLSLGVTPVYVPPRETGFQAAVESFNNIWQRKVWDRYHHNDVTALRGCSDRFISAYVRRLAPRGEQAPQRRPFPSGWRLNLQSGLTGRLVYLRRTDGNGAVFFLGRKFLVDRNWLHRLVRCEFHILAGEIRCYRLRRREPDQQPLTKTIKHRLPQRRFRE